MVGAGDHLSRAPSMLLHDAGGKAGVLDGVGGKGLDNEILCGDALGLSGARHGSRFVQPLEVIEAGEDEAWCDAPLVLVDGSVTRATRGA